MKNEDQYSLLEVEERVSALERARGFTNGDDSHSLNSGFHKESLSPFSFLWSFPPFSEPIERIPDPHIINKSRLLNKRLIINVGGVRHEVCFLQVKLVFIHPNHIISRSCGDFFLLSPSPDWASSPGPEHTRRSSRSAATTRSWRTSSSSTDIPDPSTQSSTFTELESCTLPTKCVSLPLERISTIGG